MTELAKFHEAVQTLKEFGIQMSETDINRVEQELALKETLPTLAELLEPILCSIQRDLDVVIRHKQNEPIQIKMVENEFVLEDTVNSATMVLSDIEGSDCENLDWELKVEVPKTKEDFTGKNNAETLVNIIKEIGPEKVATVRLKRGDYLVTNDYSRAQFGEFSKHYKAITDGWWVFTNTSTEDKLKYLIVLSNKFNLGLRITICGKVKK